MYLQKVEEKTRKNFLPTCKPEQRSDAVGLNSPRRAEGEVERELVPSRNAPAQAALAFPQKCRASGGVAQLGEHLPCKQGVRSSILLISTK